MFSAAYQEGDGDPVLTEQLPTLADSKYGPTRADHSPSGCDGKETCATPQVKAWESVCGKDSSDPGGHKEMSSTFADQ